MASVDVALDGVISTSGMQYTGYKNLTPKVLLQNHNTYYDY